MRCFSELEVNLNWIVLTSFIPNRQSFLSEKNVRWSDQKREKNLEKEKRSSKSKKKKLSQDLMKKAREENVTLKRELFALLKAQGLVISTMLKNLADRKKQLLPFYHQIQNFLRESTFGVVSIGHLKMINYFCAVKEGKYYLHFNAIFEVRVLQSLADCEYFSYVFGVFDGKSVMELITCEDNKVVTVSGMQKENELTGTDWNVVCFILASAFRYMHLTRNYRTMISSQTMFC